MTTEDKFLRIVGVLLIIISMFGVAVVLTAGLS